MTQKLPCIKKENLGNFAFLGGNVFGFNYDAAGRLTREIGLNSWVKDHSYYNTGLEKMQTTGGATFEYRYDKLGQRTLETAYIVDPNVGINFYKASYAAYDALGRMTSFQELDAIGTQRASITYGYDANGNMRTTQSRYSKLDAQGSTSLAQSIRTAGTAMTA